ncbi:hypothetical protein M0805_008219 [Coniferiporia weirii]|nr:hypothetical protein M0805_008219 [Coniferiporia weirii]
MSLTKVLVSKKVDKGLDDIFKSSAGPSTLARPITGNADVKANLKRKTENAEDDTSPKRSRASTDSGDRKQAGGKGKKGKGTRATVQEEAEDNAKVADEAKDDVHEDVHAESDSASDNDELPEHESLKKSAGKKKSTVKKAKYVPEDETREQRDARSIFVGNLPVQIVKSRPLTKQFKRHILSFVPSAKIESVRFRSVAFQNPTTALEAEEGPSTKQQRQQRRAADWREQSSGSKKEDEEAAEDRKGEKTYMMPAEKRRLAAIKGDLHTHSAATTNAYVVFAYPTPQDTEARVPRKEVMDPFEAARETAKKCDGSLFEGRTIRVDLVGGVKEKGDAKPLTDPKLSIFVGNLDFATSDDDLRAFFEKVLCVEKGKPDAETKADSEEEEDEDGQDDGDDTKPEKRSVPRKPAWVARVRVVRDRDTQLGKGFAYVQFSDRDCVDEILALESEKLKFAKRPLRVQRCKTIPGSVKIKSSQTLTKSASGGAVSVPRSRAGARAPAPVPVPRGDPTLGARIAGLSKESRKEAKSTDAARVARRLAKKKARNALEKAGVKEKSGKARARERKDKKGSVNTGRKEGKKRVRSERNVGRRNAKK